MANSSTLPPSGVVGAGSSSGTAGSTGADTVGGSTGGTTASPEIFPPFQEPVEVRGTPGNDVMIGGADDEHMLAFRGDDILFGGAGNDQLDGGIGDDRLEGGPGFDSYDGGPGGDTLTFGVADGPANVDLDTSSAVSGGVFEFVQNVENVTGSVFGDTLLGDDNDNRLVGGGGLDLLGGRLGDDLLDGGRDGAYATWAGEDGAVTVDLAAGTAAEWDGGQDTLVSIVGAIGTDFDDTLRGDAAANRLEGGAGGDLLAGRGGDDILVGGAGADTLQGGAGIDTADYSGAGPVRASLQSGEAVDEGGAVDRLSGIENLVGSLSPDVLTGDGAANRLTGGVGADTLRGGGGADTFVFTDRLDFGDTIRDFQSGLDRIEIDRAVVGDGTVSFDDASNHLLWDPDGSGDSEPVVVATVQGDGVASSDIVLV
ncbi:MAG: M10 family metallopeptidase C-terminal domain-containing protein [Magnetospirillum sp.]|nr:M10 family metallopeptidase C-terminal domain-containing protein [Magnetospirillum sp.]